MADEAAFQDRSYCIVETDGSYSPEQTNLTMDDPPYKDCLDTM